MMAATTSQTSVATEKSTQINNRVMIAFGLCLVASAAVVHVVSDYEFSSVLTLSVFFQALAHGLVILQIESTGSVEGISAKSMGLSAVSVMLRLTSTLFFEGYLPLDRTGDFTYQCVDILSLLMLLKILHSCYFTHRDSFRADQDTAKVQDMVKLCVALSLVIHPQMNGWITYDIAWMCSLYVEMVALIPQLMVTSKTGTTPAYTAEYVVATLISRGFSAWFWIYGAQNMMDLEESSLAAMMIVVAHMGQFMLLADFGYQYLKQKSAGSVH